VNRRELITLVGGAAGTWPLAVRAQQTGRMRRIGFVTGFAQADQEAQGRFAAMLAGLEALGWVRGRNIQVEERWAGADIDLLKSSVVEIEGLNPDLIVTGHTLGARLLRQSPRAIPTVFVGIADPVGSGVVDSLAKPGGNVTGFTAFEYAIGGKWLSLLKELAPKTETIGLLFNVQTAPWAQNFWKAFESAAPLHGIKPVRMDVSNAAEIERAIDALARERNAGLIGVPEVTMTLHRELIIRQLARHRLPAVYPYRYFPAQGGLASYGIDVRDMWHRSASYVDRILRGEKPVNLPVQAPTKFEFIINLKTAKALGLNLPPTLIASADEVIE
jgi:putative ABC transport system substrate-binding protein